MGFCINRFRAIILLLTSIYTPIVWFSVLRRVSQWCPLTENNTPELALRIRVRKVPPPGTFDEFSFRHFRVGQTYTVPSHLASVLILAGYAELVDTRPARGEAADFGQPRLPKRK